MNSDTIHYNKIAHSVFLEVVKYTPQLYYVEDHNNREPPFPGSSSVLISYGNNFFLVTAGHSLYKQDLTKVGIMLGHDFCTIGGNIKIWEPNDDENYEPNNLDLAIIKLDDESVSTFKEKYEFLPWTKIVFGHSSLKMSPYLVFGYPEVLTKLISTSKKIIPSPLKFRTVSAPSSTYEKAQVDPSKTLIVIAEQNNVGKGISDRGQMPDLGGISGCGVWLVTDLRTPQPQYYLASILTGDNELHTTLYSTKTDFLQFAFREFGLLNF